MGRLNFYYLPRVLPPTRIIRIPPSSIRFSSYSLPDDPEWTRMQFHKSIGTNYEKNPKNGPPQFLLHTSCTTPYEDYSETEFHSF